MSSKYKNIMDKLKDDLSIEIENMEEPEESLRSTKSF